MPIRKTRDDKTTGEFLPSRMPVIIDSAPEDWELDPEVRRLTKLMIDPSPENCEKAFWGDSIATSFTYITAAVILLFHFLIIFTAS
jgi:hypothetical protein